MCMGVVVGVYAHPGKRIYNSTCICPSVCFQTVKPQWAGSSTAAQRLIQFFFLSF